VSGNFWSLSYDGTNATAPQRLFVDAGVSGIGTDPSNGDVLYADLQSGNNSLIKRIIATNTFPVLRLSLLPPSTAVLFGSNGPPGATYSVLSSTNVDLALTNWPNIGSDAFDSNGTFRFTNALNQNSSRQFFIIH
jgi:hypothetical protein